jgi:hypothetical protein
MLFAPLLLATTLHIGDPIAIANLQRGDPATRDRVTAAWSDGSGVHAVVTRAAHDHFEVVRMTFRDDGTVDPTALVPLPVGFAHVVTPFRDGLMAAWPDRQSMTIEQLGVSRFDWPSDDVARGIACNDRRCILFGFLGGLLVDGDTGPLRQIGDRIDAVAASPFGFLTLNLETSEAIVRDNDANPKATIPLPPRAAQISYDGARYLITLPGPGTSVRIIAVDPASGFAALAHTIDVGSVVDAASLTWNGSQYLLLLRTSAGYAAMRLTLDAAPRRLFDVPAYYDPIVAGTPDGFRIFYEPDEGLRTTFVSNRGAIVPTTQPIITDRASQTPITATSGRSAILGVWREGDDVFAARVDRDATPIAVGSGPAYAASDGDDFLVIAGQRATLIGAGITQFDLPIAATSSAHLEFVDGAYRLAMFVDCRVVAMTITTAGAVTQFESFRNDCLTGGNALTFDGRTLVALWSFDNQLFSTTNGVRRQLLSGPQHTTIGTALARDRDTLLMFFALNFDGGGTRVSLDRLTDDGLLAVPFGVLASSQPADSIVRIGDTWFLASGTSVVPFRNLTLTAEKPIALSEQQDSRLFEGWDGEALLVESRDVAVPSGWATQMTVRVVGSSPSHGHAVR